MKLNSGADIYQTNQDMIDEINELQKRVDKLRHDYESLAGLFVIMAVLLGVWAIVAVVW